MEASEDIVVIGGGPVGMALALALRRFGLPAALLEARRSAAPDRRPLALSHGSRTILDRLGAWSGIEQTTPIKRIHVSQSGGFGRVMLTAEEAGLPALGYVTDYALLHDALARRLQDERLPHVEGARVQGVNAAEGCARVSYERDGEQGSLEAALVVVADGGALPNMGAARQREYDQVAVVTTIATARPHGGTAFERFTPDGPLALLPHGPDMAVVWTTSPERGAELCAMPQASFCARLNAAFGSRLGEFSGAGSRACFPLTLRIGTGSTSPRTVLIGNAAQTLHPVAGQGFNIGLRDAWELAEEAARCKREALGGPAMLAAFRRRRRVDRGGGVAFTDSLVRIFSNDIAPLRAVRGAGLALLACIPPARQFLTRRMIFGSRG